MSMRFTTTDGTPIEYHSMRWLHRLPIIAIEKPMLMIPLILLVLLGGILTYTGLVRELQSYLENPTVGVIISSPGIPAEDVEAYCALNEGMTWVIFFQVVTFP